MVSNLQSTWYRSNRCGVFCILIVKHYVADIRNSILNDCAKLASFPAKLDMLPEIRDRGIPPKSG